jgi:hypothetical protein
MRTISRIALAIALSIPTALVAQVVVQMAPPAPLLETIPAERPSTAAVWIPGHYMWATDHYVWQAGHWDQPPQNFVTWVPGQWNQQGNGWVWVEGHWGN